MESHHEYTTGEIHQDEFFIFELPTVLISITLTLKREFEFQGISEINPVELLRREQPPGDDVYRICDVSDKLSASFETGLFLEKDIERENNLLLFVFDWKKKANLKCISVCPYIFVSLVISWSCVTRHLYIGL